jgi:hypothetical protein
VSPSGGRQARDGSRACIRSLCGFAAAALAPAVDSGSDRRASRASERGPSTRRAGAAAHCVFNRTGIRIAARPLRIPLISTFDSDEVLSYKNSMGE